CSATMPVVGFNPPSGVAVAVAGVLKAHPGPSDNNQTTATATVTDAGGTAVPNVSVTFTAPSPNGNGVTFGGNAHQLQPGPSYTDTTGSDGKVTAPVQGDKKTIGKITIHAVAGGKSGDGILVQYGPPSTIDAKISPTSIPADGASTTTATA